MGVIIEYKDVNKKFGDKHILKNINLQIESNKIRTIFRIALENGHDSMVLGAFGCGAFRNPPEIVAKVFYNVMQDYLDKLEVIEYAVFHTERELANYEAFSKVMRG